MTLYPMRDDTCLLALPMHEGSGDIVYDYSRYSRNGQCYGDIYWASPELFGPTLLFDGEDDYIIINEGHEIMEIISDLESLTITLWVKKSGSASAQEYILSYGKVGQDKTIGVRFLEDGRLNFWASDSWSCSTSDEYDDDNWHFVAAVADSDIARIYVDGKKADEDPVEDFWNAPTTERDLYIGAIFIHPTGLAYRLSGLVCDLRIYGRSLSEAEIKALELYYRNFEVRPSILCPRPTL